MLNLPLHIVDCNNFVRRRHEVDTSGLALRNLYSEATCTPNPTIYVFDGKNSKAARRALYPDYKANRTPASDSFYAVLGMFKELMLCTNKVVLEIPGFEADDVITHLVRSAPTQQIKIFSNDGDFTALCNDFVTMSDPKLPKVPQEDVRLYKTLVGDTSDNIKGIAKFGPAAWENLTVEQKQTWTIWLEKEPIAVSSETLGLTKKQHEWFSANTELIRAYWQIVGFLPVPLDLFAKHMQVGTKNPELANELLKGVFQ